MKILSFICNILFVTLSVSASSASRVLELSDKFLDISEEGQWLVKFYAPWCAHCRRMEPVWAHVAQSLNNSPIRVARVDCTRFASVATHFSIRGFPTILFINGKNVHEYNGERTKDDVVEFALRMSRPPVQQVTKVNTMDYLKEINPVFFAHVGTQHGPLWEVYQYHAEKYQPHSYFYTMSHDVARRSIDTLPAVDTVFVHKDNQIDYFEVEGDVLNWDMQELNTTLNKWINSERFGTFPKVTRSNINQLMDTEKYLVLVVVAENKLNEITKPEKEFKDMVESVIRTRKESLHYRFQFGWVGSPELANSIAMTHLPLPHLLILNSTTSHHHIPEDDPLKLTPEAVAIFLEQVHNQNAPAYGGNTYLVRLYRALFEAKTSLVDMWRGNPVLTTVIFGLPLGFLSLICYSICCADILDADEEDGQEDGDHEKKD